MAKHTTRRGPRQIRALLLEFEASGLSRKDFCNKHGIKYPTFCRWLQNQANADGLRTKSSQNTNGFVELELPEPAQADGPSLRLSLPDGKVVEFFPPLDVSLVKALVFND